MASFGGRLPNASPHDLNVLKSIVEEHRGNSEWELPQLVMEQPWWEEWRTKFWNWLTSLFPDPKIRSGFDLANLLNYAILIIKILIVLVLITAVIWLIRTAFKAYRAKTTKPFERVTEVAPVPDEWESELSRALGAGNLSLAARIRWRIFLYRLAIHPSTTPLEFFRQQAEPNSTLAPAYELMFFNVASPDSRFQQWAKLLDEEERKR